MKKRLFSAKMASVLLVAIMVLTAAMGVFASAAEGTFMDNIEEGAELTYWEMNWGDANYENIVQGFVDKFNEENEYGIKVNLQMIPWDGYYQTFLTAVTSGAAPDVCTGASTAPTQYAQMGTARDLMPIMEAWEAEGNPILEDIPEQYWGFFDYEGGRYALPYGADPKQIMYRTDFFEEAGITELPKTYDEVLDVCAVLLEKFPDKLPILMCGGGNVPSSNHVAEVLSTCNNTGMITEDFKPNMSSPEQIENYEFIKKLYDNGYISEGTAGYGDTDVQRIWLSGGACILWGPAGNFVFNTDVEEFCRIMPNISGPSADGQGTYCPNINGVFGFNQTQYPNASMYFLKYWMENSAVLLTDSTNGNLPLRATYFADPFFSENPIMVDTLEYTIKNGKPQAFPSPTRLRTAGSGSGHRTRWQRFLPSFHGMCIFSTQTNGSLQTIMR